MADEHGAAIKEFKRARAIAADFKVRDSKLGDEPPVFDLPAADFTGLLRVVGSVGAHPRRR